MASFVNDRHPGRWQIYAVEVCRVNVIVILLKIYVILSFDRFNRSWTTIQKGC